MMMVIIIIITIVREKSNPVENVW